MLYNMVLPLLLNKWASPINIARYFYFFNKALDSLLHLAGAISNFKRFFLDYPELGEKNES